MTSSNTPFRETPINRDCKGKKMSQALVEVKVSFSRSTEIMGTGL